MSFKMLRTAKKPLQNANAKKPFSYKVDSTSGSLRAMWILYEAVIEVLRKIWNDDFADTKGKAPATGLLDKVLWVDFVVSLMFMRIIL